MNKMILMAAVAFAVPAFAQEVNLGCGEGTRAFGGPKHIMESAGCVKLGTDGSRVFHGPFVAYWKNGAKQAEGQMVNGQRTGKWVFFDQAGLKTGETSFKNDVWDGERVEFHANGSRKSVELYTAGKLQGAPQFFDLTGRTVTVK